MNKVFNLKEAQKWFMENDKGSVICVNNGGEKKEVNYYYEAEEFYNPKLTQMLEK